jgi:membrane protein DedA with SNARE-associated domain
MAGGLMNDESGAMALCAGGAGIFLLSFLSEDSATLTAALLAALGKLSWPLAFASCFLGIWVGDLGLYVLARLFGRPVVGSLFLHSEPARLRKSEDWFARRGLLALVICRFIPGTRLPTFLAAGVLRMPAGRFALVTGLLAAGWVGMIFVIFRWFEVRPETALDLSDGVRLAAAAVLLLAFLTDTRALGAGSAQPPFGITRDPAVDEVGILAGLAFLFPCRDQLSAAFPQVSQPKPPHLRKPRNVYRRHDWRIQAGDA